MTTRSLLDQELNDLRDNLLRLGSMVESAIDRSVGALKKQDTAAAQQIIADDRAINDLRHQIEEACIATIATQQPMASDLRTIIAVTHIAVELERMGDHAAGIAVIVNRIGSEPLLKPLIDIPRMAQIDRAMLRAALDAFIEGDVERAKAAGARDEEVDQLYDQVFRELLSYMLEDPRNIRQATFLLWAGHLLERIGDRATNIGERVIYMATGQREDLNP
jgi:phosphate transport system protein